jgi:hypothetical protein
MNKLTVAARKREIIIKNWINTTRIGVALQISQENWRKVPKKPIRYARNGEIGSKEQIG